MNKHPHHRSMGVIPPDYTPAEHCLRDRVILVTGASGGIGRVAALNFARHGATVVLHGRNAARLDAVYDQIGAAGYPQPAILLLDYMSATEADYQGMAQTILDAFQRLDGIFHAAGHMSPLTPLALQNLATWQAHQTVNVLAPTAITRACLPMLSRAPAPMGKVVFLSATPALDPKAYWGAFAVTKAALVELAAIWNDERAPAAAQQFFVLVPGPVASPARSISHPGELATEVPAVVSLIPAMLYLLTGSAAGDAPFVFQVQGTHT